MKSEQVVLARRIKFSLMRKEVKKDRDRNPLDYPPDFYEQQMKIIDKIIETLDWCLQDDVPEDLADVKEAVNLKVLLENMDNSSDSTSENA